MKQQAGFQSELNAFALIIARIAEVVFALAAALHLTALTMFCINPGMFAGQDDGSNTSITTQGDGIRIGINGMVLDNEIRLLSWDGRISTPAVIVVSVGVTVVAVLFALVFHEVATLCARLGTWQAQQGRSNGHGQNWQEASGSLSSPFDAGLGSSLRRVGWYLVAAPIVGWVTTLVSAPFSNGWSITLSVSLVILMISVLAFLLAHVFDYGAQLQIEVDGLL